MGAKNSKKINTNKKKKGKDEECLQLQKFVSAQLKKLNSEVDKKFHKPGFSNDLKKKMLDKYKESFLTESLREEKSIRKEIIEDIEPKKETEGEKMTFTVKPINEIETYFYGHPSKAFISSFDKHLEKTENNQMLTLVLEDQQKELKVDRNALTLNSEYLRNNLPLELSKLPMRGYQFESIQAILICLYTEKLYLSINTFNDILKLCYEFKLNVILKFLTKLVDECDPICTLNDLREILANYDVCDTRSYTRVIYDVQRNFSKIIKYAGIVDVTFEELKLIVKKREEIRSYLSLSQRNELHVFYAIVDWILHDKNSKFDRSFELLPFVQFDKMTVEQWKQAFNPQLLLSFPEKLQQLMFSIHDYHVANDKSRKLSVFDVYLAPSKLEKDIGEKAEKFEDITIAHEEGENKKTQVKHYQLNGGAEYKNKAKDEELEKIAKEALATFKNLAGDQMLQHLQVDGNSFDEHSIILLLGGYQSQVAHKTEQGLFMHQFKPFGCCVNKDKVPTPNISDYVWSPFYQRLPKSSSHFPAVKVGSVIFTLGGIDATKLLHEKTLNPVNDCYAYSIANDDWYRVAPMHYSRGYHKAVLVHDKIFVFGGISLVSKKVTLINSSEIFDIKKNAWTEVISGTSMPSPRIAFGMVYYQDVVWVIGGLTNISNDHCYQTGDLLSDVWIYSLQHQKWTSIEFWRLPKPRAFMTTVLFRNQIFVIGGHEVEEKVDNDQRVIRDSRTNSVLIFRDVNSAWEEGPSLNSARIYATATVVDNVLFVIGGITHNHKYIDESILRQFSGSYEVYNPNINPNWVENSMVFSLYAGNAITVKSKISNKPLQ